MDEKIKSTVTKKIKDISKNNKGAPRRKRTPQEIREEMLKRLEESEFSNKYSDRIASIKEADEKAKIKMQKEENKKNKKTETKKIIFSKQSII